MRMLLSNTGRAPALAAALCLAMLAGCASKNPLMDDAGSSAAQPAATATAAADNSGAKTVEPTTTERFLRLLKPYRVDIQQGNFVSKEMLAQLQVGMTRDQVRFVLGTPLLTDIFHADRWDYPFSLKKGNGEIITSQVTTVFKDNLLTRIEGGNLPTEKEYISLIAGSKNTPAAEIPAVEAPVAPTPAAAPAEIK